MKLKINKFAIPKDLVMFFLKKKFNKTGYL